MVSSISTGMIEQHRGENATSMKFPGRTHGNSVDMPQSRKIQSRRWKLLRGKFQSGILSTPD